MGTSHTADLIATTWVKLLGTTTLKDYTHVLVSIEVIPTEIHKHTDIVAVVSCQRE